MTQSYQRKGITLSDGTKYCPKCEQIKPTSEFYPSKSQSGGFAAYCKTCCYERHNKWRKQNLPKMRDASRKWREDNPEATKDHCLKSRVGIPLGTYERLFAEQNGMCAVCGSKDPKGRTGYRPVKRFHVDHDANTGRIRGLLCHGCNVGIGLLRHNISILEAAMRYLTRTSS